jgi:hypothetical protein
MTNSLRLSRVEETTVTDGGQPRRIDVPVEVAGGYESGGSIRPTEGDEDANIRRSSQRGQQGAGSIGKFKAGENAGSSRHMRHASPMPSVLPSRADSKQNQGFRLASCKAPQPGKFSRLTHRSPNAVDNRGAVQVQITVDESGEVTDARGHQRPSAAPRRGPTGGQSSGGSNPTELSGKAGEDSRRPQLQLRGGNNADAKRDRANDALTEEQYQPAVEREECIRRSPP